MAKLTAAKRNALPSSDAANAKARAAQHASPAERTMIDAKANRVLDRHPHRNLGGYLHPRKDK